MIAESDDTRNTTAAGRGCSVDKEKEIDTEVVQGQTDREIM